MRADPLFSKIKTFPPAIQRNYTFGMTFTHNKKSLSHINGTGK